MPPITENVRQSFAIGFLCLVLLVGVYLAVLQVVIYSAKPASPGPSPAPQAYSTQTTATYPSGRHIISRDADGLFYVNGHVDGVMVRFAVDTGASVVVLNSADAERIGLELDQHFSDRIRTASGYSQMLWRQVDNVTIDGRVLGKLDIAIMEKGPDVSLLGLNALSRLGSVTMENDQLTIVY